MLFRFLLWMIIIFILAKILGAVFRVIRSALRGPESQIHGNHQHQKASFPDAEDADFEDITDKK